MRDAEQLIVRTPLKTLHPRISPKSCFVDYDKQSYAKKVGLRDRRFKVISNVRLGALSPELEISKIFK